MTETGFERIKERFNTPLYKRFFPMLAAMTETCSGECEQSECCGGGCKEVKKPKKWWEVYPQGTKVGSEEQKFFVTISRHTKYKFRSVSQLSKETGLTKERIEQIIQKYHKAGMIFQNPKNEEQWGYWENCPECLPKKKRSVGNKDKKNRINEELKK